MHDDVKNNARDSDMTSPSDPAGKTPETEFLQSQAAEARGAIENTLRQMGESVKAVGNVQAWAREYPLPTVGVAAALGFLAASSVMKSRSEPKASNTLVERLLADKVIANRIRELAAEDGTSDAKPILGSLASPLFKALGDALQSAVVAAIAARSAAAANEQQAAPEPPSDSPAQ